MIVPASRESHDGIRDFAAHLAAALAPAVDLQAFTVAGDAAPAPRTTVLPKWSALPREESPRAIFVNYAPQAWLRRDVAPMLARLRAARAAGARVILIVHEYQLDPGPSLTRRAARIAFARLARAFARASTSIVSTHEFVGGWARADGLERYAPIVTIPAGSNIPDPVDAAAARQNRVVMFGQPAGMSPRLTRAGLEAASERGFAVQWICRREEEPRAWMRAHGIGGDGVALAAGLDGRAISHALQSAAIGFAPIVDGVSTRRTTVAALAQHGLPIVGSDGRATDRLFRESGGFLLAPLDDARAMQRHLRQVIAAEPSRERMGAAARAFYDTHLAWPRIAGDYLRLAG
jgi:glycosyltransferase involved in cell wall biosynthesis